MLTVRCAHAREDSMTIHATSKDITFRCEENNQEAAILVSRDDAGRLGALLTAWAGFVPPPPSRISGSL